MAEQVRDVQYFAKKALEAYSQGRLGFQVKGVKSCEYDYRMHGFPNSCFAIGAGLTQEERDALAKQDELSESITAIDRPAGVKDRDSIILMRRLQFRHDRACLIRESPQRKASAVRSFLALARRFAKGDFR
jgi:hypothetical protein